MLVTKFQLLDASSWNHNLTKEPDFSRKMKEFRRVNKRTSYLVERRDCWQAGLTQKSVLEAERYQSRENTINEAGHFNKNPKHSKSFDRRIELLDRALFSESRILNSELFTKSNSEFNFPIAGDYRALLSNTQ